MKSKILIVDDKVQNLVALETLLRDLDVEFVRALSGNEALQKVLEHDFAIALIDVQMPEMDGFETVELLRKIKKTKYLPVIFVSAIYSENYYRIKGVESGAVDFIIKPIIPEILFGKVKIFLGIYDQKLQLEEEIKNRIKIENELAESEEKFRTISTSANDGIIMIDSKDNIIYCNIAAENIFGYKENEIIGNTLDRIIHSGKHHDTFINALRKLKKKEKSTIADKIIEMTAIKKDGNEFPIELSLSSVKINKEWNAVGIIRDITERVQANTKLQKSESKYRSIFELSPEAIVLSDNSGTIIDTNDRLFDWLGYESKSVIGKKLFKLPFLPKESEKIIINNFHKRMAGKEVLSYELDFITKKGEKRVGLILASPLKNEKGQIIGDLILIPDITERKLDEELKGMLIKQLETVNLELKEFAYVVSHDLKAPLRGISTLAEWILEDYADKFDAEGKEQMGLMISRVHRMHNLIDGILQYSRVGKTKEDKDRIDLNILIPEIIDSLNPPENIEIVLDKNLPEITVEKTRIQQVFLNLLSNAIKYIDKPKGLIKVGCEDKEERWEFFIQDNGPGIEKKYFEKVFKIFQTLQSRDKMESTGIGLTTVKKIIKLINGDIWLESEIGKSTTFFFSIPKKFNEEIEI